jgi:hypothetical protein
MHRSISSDDLRRHVFVDDSADVPVSLQWESCRSGAGSWYLSALQLDVVQIEITPSDTTGFSEHYTRPFGDVLSIGESDTTLTLTDLSVGTRQYSESYRKVGPP